MSKLNFKLELFLDMYNLKFDKRLIIYRLPISLLMNELIYYFDISDILRLLPIYYTRNEIIIILQIIKSLPIESYDDLEETVSFIQNFYEILDNFDEYNKFDIVKYVKYLNKQKIHIIDISQNISNIKLMEIDYEYLNNYINQLCLTEEIIRDCENSMNRLLDQVATKSICDLIKKPNKEYTLETNQKFTRKINMKLSILVQILISYKILKVVNDLDRILLNITDSQFGKEFINYYEQYNTFSFSEYDEISDEELLDDDMKFIEIPYYIIFRHRIDKRMLLVNPNFIITDPNSLAIDFPTDAFNRFDYYYDLIKLYLNLPYIQDDSSFVYKFITKDHKTLNFNLLSISKIIYMQEHLQYITYDQMLQIGKNVIDYCRKKLLIGKKLIKGTILKDSKEIEFFMYPNTKEVYDTIIKCLEQIVC
jgi:hypothetical protein